MPCYLDTIIKIKYVKQNETKDTKSVSVWAIGLYPAVFRKDEYYFISGKIIPSHYAGSTKPKMIVATSTHLTISSRVSDSNKCPLKVSLIGTPQEKPTVIGNTDNSIIEMLITDHISQYHKYTINVVFSHTNPRFENLKTSIQPQESMIFVVGQMEVIDNKFYVNAKDITYININILKKNSEPNNKVQLISTTSTRSKLLQIHQSVTKNLKDIPVIQTSPITALNDVEYESSKHKRSEEVD
ncbi:hypothetical protein C2G38_2202953 [Gigaspora rosea]|uniref:Uncharacterized protein n=1 Tax=Gigaspora rosea TaxID=44941 RepID=A0A397US69_9GLOM|nr:hypothetical protein C2G38_2202953 [Gigaspora rosea]